MRIAFYHDTSRFENWTWHQVDRGLIALSGTDGAMVRLPGEVARLGHETTLYCTKAPAESGSIQTELVSDLPQAVRKAKSSENAVIVFNNRGDDETRAGIFMCEQVGLPCVIWDHNGPSPDFRDVLLSPSVRKLVCVSNAQADEVRDHPVFNKTHVIYNALPSVHAPQPPSSPEARSNTVCFLGGLMRNKGFHYLAQAWPSIRKRIPDARLNVLGSSSLYGARKTGPLGIGDPDYEIRDIIPYLGRSATELEAKGVKLMGLVRPVEAREILGNAAIGVVNPHCSRCIETFCVSAIEIQAAAAVVVGGNAGGLRETILHGRTGLLIKKESELADTIVWLLSRPLMRANMGRAARQWVLSAFSQDDITAQWCKLLTSAAKGESDNKVKIPLAGHSARILAKEAIRYARKVPLIGQRVPSLHQFRTRLSS